MKLNAYILLLLSLIYMGELANLSSVFCLGPDGECCKAGIKMYATGFEECKPDDCSNTGKTENEPKDCNEYPYRPVTCSNCPLNYISTFEECFTIIITSQVILREYVSYSDQLISNYSPDTWKPPNAIS